MLRKKKQGAPAPDDAHKEAARPRGKGAASREAPAQAADNGDLRIGETARGLRKAANLGLQELADRTGISAAMLSQLERGLSTPSLRTLRLLSVALDVPISRFFEEPSQGSHPSFVVRAEDRRLLRLTSSGVTKYLISPNTPSWIEMYELQLAPGGSSGNDFQSHTGEKAGYVLEGELQLTLNDEVFVLGAGDAFRFPSLVPHMFMNPADAPARIIWINASTTFAQ